jgi:hypothetical protein
VLGELAKCQSLLKDYRIMSGISSIGGYNYYQQLEQSIAQKDAQAAESQAAAATAADATASTEPSTTTTTSTTSNTTSLQDKIKTAIMSAVQNAENSDGSTDLLSVIRNAVDKTLKDAGINPATAEDNDKVDPSTKKLLAVLDKQVKAEAESTNLLNSLSAASGMNSSSIDLLAQLSMSANGTQVSQNLLGYLFDAQQ